MRRSIVFILILATSSLLPLFACGPYYPFGDDIRFVLLKPGTFDYPEYTPFCYSADIFYDPSYNNDNSSSITINDENIRLWRKRCKSIPNINDTYNAIYIMNGEINKPDIANTFIQYLQKNKDAEALNYLNFAKKCSPFNIIIDDPWERNEYANIPKRKQLITQALEKAKSINDEDLKLRYAFLAIRLAYYNNDRKATRDIYNQYFNNRLVKNIIDYWGMYFMTFAEPDSVKRNYYASQVFFFAPDKRRQIFFSYNKGIPIESTLKYAKNNEEKTAVWMMAGFRKMGKALEILKNIHSLKPELDGLSVLLLREVNKLENWVFTPYYTSFEPSLEPRTYENETIYPAKRIRDDRIYARELLDFVSSVDFKKVDNPILWKIAKAYLTYITENFKTSLQLVETIQKTEVPDARIKRQLDILKSLCLTAMQDKPIIEDEIKPVLMSEFDKTNYKFIFAIARELEFKGNTTEAAILLSKLKDRKDNDNWRNGIYWRTKTYHYTLYVNYYDDYFFYLDAQFNANQVEELITNVQAAKGNDAFAQWEYSVIKKDIYRLYDLLGTKYLRVNNLNSALNNFKKVNDTLWNSRYFYYSTYLNANPFYTNMYNEHRKTIADTVKYNKTQITAKLIDYLGKAENKNNQNRDYYCFLAANCYLNMTQYGNSWIMKRYYWTSSLHKTKLEDDEDYFSCKRAKQYYLKANEVSKNKKFAALCLRMAARCEEYNLTNNVLDKGSVNALKENIYFKELKKNYPDYSTDLISNCESFESYFKCGHPGVN